MIKGRLKTMFQVFRRPLLFKTESTAACAAATAFAVSATFFFVVDYGQLDFFRLFFFVFGQVVDFDFVFF